MQGGGGDNLDFSLNILVLVKIGVGKGAAINSIAGGKKIATVAMGFFKSSNKIIILKWQWLFSTNF